MREGGPSSPCGGSQSLALSLALTAAQTSSTVWGCNLHFFVFSNSFYLAAGRIREGLLRAPRSAANWLDSLLETNLNFTPPPAALSRTPDFYNHRPPTDNYTNYSLRAWFSAHERLFFSSYDSLKLRAPGYRGRFSSSSHNNNFSYCHRCTSRDKTSLFLSFVQSSNSTATFFIPRVFS